MGDIMKIHTILLSLLLSFSFASGQEIIENPEKPLSENAGRVLKIQEVMRIQDEGDEFFFKQPIIVQVANNGCIFLSDRDAFFKFSQEGKFITNLYKKGQGPGEIQGSFQYLMQEDCIFIHDRTGLKIIQIDQNGDLIREYKLDERYNDFLGVFNQDFLFSKINFYRPGEKGELNIPIEVLLVSQKSHTISELINFSMKVFYDNGSMGSLSPFHFVFDQKNNTLFVCDSSEYLVQMLDIESVKIKTKFNRVYNRIKGEKKLMPPSLSAKFPDKKFEDDIKNLFKLKENLLVQTSTKDEKKGVLIDVFDHEGQFIDNFYLDIEGTLIGTHDNFLFSKETNEMGEISIVKYKILE